MNQLYIVHIGNYLLQPASGVYQKYMALHAALSPIVRVKLIAFTDRDSSNAHPAIEVIHIDIKNKWRSIHQWMSENIKAGDVVWLRYPFASKGLYELTCDFGKQIILEHNTNELAEAIQIQRRAWKAGGFTAESIFRRSFWKYTWATWVSQKTDESRWGVKCIEKVRGGIAVTHELSESLKSRCPNYPVYILPNCVQERDLNWGEKGMSERSGKAIRLVMLIGSYDYWQGLERIVSSIEGAGELSARIDIDIYGQLPDHFRFESKGGIQLKNYPPLSQVEMSRVLPSYDMGIGTLSLYKKHMNEACPLKVREYWKAGIPCLMGYMDTAVINHPELMRYNYKVPNDASMIPWQSIIDQIQKWRLTDNVQSEMMALYSKSITYESQIPLLMDFLFKKQSS